MTSSPFSAAFIVWDHELNREISKKLWVSTETVRTHVRRILNKLDVTSRTKAASVVREVWPDFAEPEPE